MNRDYDPDAPPPISTIRQTSSNKVGSPTASARKGGATAAAPASSPEGSSDSLQTPSFRYSNTLTFLRGVLGQRNQDYVSDAPQSYPSNPSLRHVASSRRFLQGGADPNRIEEDGTELNFCQRLCSCCPQRRQRRSPDQRKQYIWRILTSSAWNSVLIGFTVILLFGAQLRDLAIPKGGDTAVDYVFLLSFIFFWVDVIMRVDAETNYFHLYLCNAVSYSSGVARGQLEDRMGTTYLPCGRRSLPVHLGSFLFWCDVISTLTLLREISFFGVLKSFDEAEIKIELDTLGMPISLQGLGLVNEACPVEYYAIDLLAIIFKSMRVARFIRSSSAVKLASRLNSIEICMCMRIRKRAHYFNPLWWWNRCRKRFKNEDPRRGLPAEIIARRDGSETFIRRNSWRNVILSSKVKRSMLPHETSSKKGIRGLCIRMLRHAGILKDNKKEFRRQMAATKIQRAWRQHYREISLLEGVDNHATGDVAWNERGAATNPMEKVMKKRSMLQDSLARSATAVTSRYKTVDSERPNARHRRNESQVGSAMRELTGQRVAIGIIGALVMTVLLTYSENSATRPTTMIVLHTQTSLDKFANTSLTAAKGSSIPDLYSYTLANGENRAFPLENGQDPLKLRAREKLRIQVSDAIGSITTGYFSFREEKIEEAWVSICSTIFVLLVWFFGVTSFAGPVMVLVVKPIERMVRLLEMLMRDPLGYQSTSRFRRFLSEEDEITKNTHWTKEVLKGMETSFLMSTILRIGSLMKVGFGSAGVEIIRRNLQRGQTRNMLILSEQGSTVSCIFLFSDIRQFTDATECLQEEVFVFTNRIAAVVHSICHSYGGSANKNIGDAFLLSWLLDEQVEGAATDSSFLNGKPVDNFVAKSNQADKALLSVVKICMALHHDDYYVETMSEVARNALLAKLSKRKGPIVQMGFGLHAGTAVQGAIGSTRKIDATYVSEAVERAEYLESSTKKYGLKMLMSDSFHRLLHPNNRRRCRKIDQIIIRSEDDDDEDDGLPDGDIVELLTYDMDIDALWRDVKQGPRASSAGRESDSDVGSEKGTRREGLRLPQTGRQGGNGLMKGVRRRSLRLGKDLQASDELSDGNFMIPAGTSVDHAEVDNSGPPELELPTGPALYSANYWIKSPEIRKMRERYTDGLFFHDFNTGLQSFYARDWDRAKHCFVNILDRFEDGPSRYFLNQIEEHGGVPPRSFKPYAIE